MQTVIKEYGESILAAVVTVLVIGLIFGGLSLIGKLDVITGKIDTSLVQEAEASSETALKKHMDIPAANMDMSGEELVICGRQVSIPALIKVNGGRADKIHISHVYLLEGGDFDNEGYEVTDQVLSRTDQVLTFDTPGSYRLVVNVTDSNHVVSDYQVFVTAVERRNA